MLTPRQYAAYEFIAGFVDRWGFAPSYEEIRGHLGLRSLNAVAKLIAQLRRRGALAPSPPNAKRSLSPRAWGRARSEPVGRRGRGPERAPATVPLLGIVAAGRPIEAIENPEPVEVSPSLLGSGERYALRVRGDSMIDDGIRDGDLIVVRRALEADDGRTVVAVVDGETTLKRFYRHGAQVELRAANPAVQPMSFPASRVQIRGILVGLVRRYS